LHLTFIGRTRKLQKAINQGLSTPLMALHSESFWIQKVSDGAGNARVNENADLNKVQHEAFGIPLSIRELSLKMQKESAVLLGADCHRFAMALQQELG
jgi:hypothetical protein